MGGRDGQIHREEGEERVEGRIERGYGREEERVGGTEGKREEVGGIDTGQFL